MQTGAPDDVRLRPVNALVARLMGQTNVLEGTVVATPRGGGAGAIRWGNRRLEVASTHEFREGERVAWLVPSDFIALADPGAQPVGETANLAAGTVAAIKPLGEMTAVMVRIGEGEDDTVRVNVPALKMRASGYAVGDRVGVHLIAEGIHLMPPEKPVVAV